MILCYEDDEAKPLTNNHNILAQQNLDIKLEDESNKGLEDEEGQDEDEDGALIDRDNNNKENLNFGGRHMIGDNEINDSDVEPNNINQLESERFDGDMICKYLSFNN